VVDPIETIRPYPAAVIRGTTDRHMRNAVLRLRASAAFQAASDISATSSSVSQPDDTDVMPALFTSTSIRPHRSNAARTRLSAAPSTVRSAITPTAASPSSAAR